MYRKQCSEKHTRFDFLRGKLADVPDVSEKPKKTKKRSKPGNDEDFIDDEDGGDDGDSPRKHERENVIKSKPKVEKQQINGTFPAEASLTGEGEDDDA